MDNRDVDIDYTTIDIFGKKRSIWYAGTRIGLDESFDRFFDHLERRGHVIVGEPRVADYIGFAGTVCWVIYFKSFPKLEYLEYMYMKKVKKLGKATM